jgi:hypothetical protein
MPSALVSGIAVLVQPHSQLLDIGEILRPPSLLFHLDQGAQRAESDRDRSMQRLGQGPPVLFLEREKDAHEHVDGRLRVCIAPELQHLHALFFDPAVPIGLVRELSRRNRHRRAVTE